MKGILLAGGNGTRLYPLTKTTSKQLLPVYDKPMIYYPLSVLMLFGITDILIISTPQDTPNIENLLGTGNHLGLNISYAVQDEPNGIPQAFLIGEEFIGDDQVCLILGDNIFYMANQYHIFLKLIENNDNENATIFAYHVSDPERFGIIEFDSEMKVLSIEEKPSKPKSNFASVGLYFYPSDVAQQTRKLNPSSRGELEITDLNNRFLAENRLKVVPLSRGNAWLDAGTPDSLMSASQFVQIIEQRQGLKIACLEEIALRKNFIDLDKFKSLCDSYPNSLYRDYLKKIYVEFSLKKA